VREAAKRFKALGASVEEVSIPDHLIAPAIWTPITLEGLQAQMMLGNGMGFNWKGLYTVSLLDAHANWRQTADDLIWKGNIELLQHEQRALVQPNFDRLSCASARLVSIGSATSFEARGVRREVACFTSFYLYSLTRGIPHALRAQTWPRITRFDDRWRWLVTSVVPQFRRFDADTRLVNASLRHILDEARDFASTPCVLPRSPADGPRRAARPRRWHRPRPEG